MIHVWILLVIIPVLANEATDMNCKPTGECISCATNDLMFEECNKTGWIREYTCYRLQNGELMEEQKMMKSCSVYGVEVSKATSHLEAFMVFLCLTVVFTVLMLMRRRTYFNNRSFRTMYGLYFCLLTPLILYLSKRIH